MVKFALAAVLLAAPSFAQVRAVPASAWSAPIGTAGGAAGLARVNSFGSAALTSMLTPGIDDTVPVFAKPELLEPLAEELAARGVTPESFSGLWLDAKLGVLSEAAKAVERRYASEVSALAGRALETAPDENELRSMEASMEAVSKRGVYLRPGSIKALALTRERIEALNRSRTRALEAFYKDLPKVLAENVRREGGLLVETRIGRKKGWRGVDGHPDELHETVFGVLESRAASVEALPSGPWTVKLDELVAGGVHQAIQTSLLEAPADERRGWESWKRSRRALERAVDAPVARSAARLAQGRGGIADIETVEDYYGRALEAAEGWREKAVVLAGVWNGSGAFPSWRSMKEKRRAIAARMERIGVFGAPRWWITALPLLVAGLTGVPDASLPAWAALALGAIIAGPVLLMLWASRRETAASIPLETKLHALMDKHFRE